MKLTAPNYRFSVTCDGGTISLHDAAGVLIGSLTGHRAPLCGNDADALWDATQWLMMAPQDGHGVDDTFWDEHSPNHYAWLRAETSREDILLDFAEAAAEMGSEDAWLFCGGNEHAGPEDSEWHRQAREAALDLQADAKYDAMQEEEL